MIARYVPHVGKRLLLFTPIVLVIVFGFGVSTVLAAPPSNDNIANATFITSLPYSDSMSNQHEATMEATDPTPSCSFFGFAGVSNTVWYRFIVASAGTLTLDTLGSYPDNAVGGPSGDTVLAVYTGSPGSLTEVACNDDYITTPTTYNSRISMSVTAGTTYYVMVANVDETPVAPGGMVFFNVSGTATLVAPPANDNIANATEITTFPFSTSQNNQFLATMEATDPTPSCSFFGFAGVSNTVWYRFTIVNAGTVTLDTLGSYPDNAVGGPSGDTVLAVYTGSPGSLTEVACNDDYITTPTTYNSRISMSVTAGTTYYVMVANVDETPVAPGGMIFLNVSGTATLSTPPSVTINQSSGQADPTNASPIIFDVVFSKPVTGFDGSDISFAGSTVGGTLSASVTGSGATYTVSVTGMSGAGVVVATIPAGRAVDSAGTGNTASTSTDNIVAFDNIAPTVTINQASGQADPTNTSPIVFDVVFSKPVTGFDGSDISFVGSTVDGTLSASVSGSGTTYTVSVTGMSGAGDVIASVVAGAAQDTLGNSSLASTSTDNVVTYDTVPPTVTINQAAGQNDPTNTSPITFDVVFSEPVTGFDGSDISFTGSTVGGMLSAVVSGSGTTYTVNVTGMSGTGTVVANIPADAAQDAVGNNSLASTSTDNTVTFDTDAPSVTINQAVGQGDPTNAGPIIFDVVFSEPVTGFDASDVDFTGSTVGGTLSADVSGSDTTYTVSVTGMNGEGTVVASVVANAAQDGGGNGNIASSSADNVVSFDNIAPSVTINQAVTQADPTNASPIIFDVVFSEPVIGFDASDVDFTGSTVGGTLSASVSGSGTIYTVSVTDMSGTGTVVVSIPADSAQDAVGNNSLASTSTDNTVTFDTTVPTVIINQAAGQNDPTNVSPITFDVVFSEPVTGFDEADVILGGTAGASSAVVSGSGAVYSVAVSGMTNTGTVTADIVAGAAVNAAGTASSASTSTDNTVLFTVDSTDSDGDGLDDTTEGSIGTDPFNPDSDGDGYMDGEEIVSGSDPLNLSSVPPVSTVPSPPPAPFAEDVNPDTDGVVRTGIPDSLVDRISIRVLYQNGRPTQWLGGNLYNAGAIGIQGVLDLGVIQAIDIFSTTGLTYFQGGAVFCLRGEGTLIWMAARNAPRVAEIIGSYTVDDFPGFTCATLFEPGTLVLVRENPIDQG